jgi:23S rRNA (cytidine1920-2'-O)/16S rRNA (cytidine1409-2'-O)-methyltransferase
MKAPRKERLDVLLVERGLADTRNRAQALIRAGDVRVGGEVHDKPGERIAADAVIALRAALPYVSRGGYKLAAALDAFGVSSEGRICLDVGACTGGFTDVLVQRGAAQVYAVDVGRAQLAWKLRTDPRVTCLERTDIRALGALPQAIDLATVDVAFISLTHVLPAIQRLLRTDGQAIALVKPQFEAGRARVGRGGVVRDPAVHRSVLTAVLTAASRQGWRVLGATASPITGADGNREFLAWLGMPASGGEEISVEAAVAIAMTENSPGGGTLTGPPPGLIDEPSALGDADGPAPSNADGLPQA